MQTFEVTQRLVYKPTFQLEVVRLVVEAETDLLAESAARQYLTETYPKLPECDVSVDCNPQYFRIVFPPTYRTETGRCWKLAN